MESEHPRLYKRDWHAKYAERRLAEFADRCRARGLAITPQRMAIIGALLNSAEHPRAEAIYSIVRKQYPHMSLATVHRTLETLCRIGEARKVTALHDSARYDGNTDSHHHVVCVNCREIRDVEVPAVGKLLGARKGLGDYLLLGVTVEIQALCKRCQKNRAEPRTG